MIEMPEEVPQHSVEEALTINKPNDIIIIACRPLEPSEEEMMIGESIGIDMTHRYEGDMESQCYFCERAVCMGPRQVELAARTSGQQVTVCLVCAAILQRVAQGENFNPNVYSLGNPEFGD